jgi:hypothetical protein
MQYTLSNCSPKTTACQGTAAVCDLRPVEIDWDTLNCHILIYSLQFSIKYEKFLTPLNEMADG